MASISHIHYTVYMVLYDMILYLVGTDYISFMTEIIFFCIFQYIYYMCNVVAIPPRFHAFQKCNQCNKMTPQHFIHCDVCKECVGTSLSHRNIINKCVNAERYNQYLSVLRGIIILNIVLTCLSSVIFWPMLPLIIVHAYMLKSTYDATNGYIYVK